MIRWNKEEILRALETDVGKEAKAQLRDIVEGHFSEPVRVDERILRCLQMARDTITTMEDNFNAGRPGFSCDVIDEIDKAINLLTQQPVQVNEELIERYAQGIINHLEKGYPVVRMALRGFARELLTRQPVQVDEGLIEKITELADSCVGTDIDMRVDGFDLDEFKQELRELLTQKRTVTEEQVRQLCYDISMGNKPLREVKVWLKELGIGVVTKK